VGVEVGSGHGVAFFVDEAVGVAVDGGVHAEGEYVLMVGGEDAGMNHGSPRNGDALVDRLGADNSRSTDFIRDFAGLIEYESQDVFVV